MNKYLSTAMAGLIGILLLSGCSPSSASTNNNSVVSNSPSQSESNKSSTNVSPENTTESRTITPPNAGLKQWSFDGSVGQHISQELFGTSFNAFYLPMFITKNDAYVGVESNKNIVTVHFKNMTLTQSPESILPSGKVAQSKVITMPNMFTGSKVTVYTMSDKNLILSMKVPLGTHILLSSSSIPLDQLETILQNIVPLNG